MRTAREKAIFIIDEIIGLWQDNGVDENYFFDQDTEQNDWDNIMIEINTIIHQLKKRI